MNYYQRHELHHDDAFVLATLRKRFVAFLMDWIVLIMLYYGIILLFRLFHLDISKINVNGIFDVEIEMNTAHGYIITLMKILCGFLPVVYFTLSFYFFKGQTIGKYFLKIKVVSLYHEQLGLWHCFERSLGYFASALEFGFGFIQAFWNPNRMTLHDKIGETMVIERLAKRRGSKPTSAPI